MRRTLLTALAFATLLAGCGDDSPTRPAAGPTAHLGLVANPPDFAYADSIGSALLTARATGATMFQAGELWSTLESAPGAFDGAAIRRQLGALQSLGFATYFNFRIVDTNQRGVPADLAGTAWDDPAMIARVDVAIDTLLAVATRFPLLALSFGNEVDGYFATRPAELPAFRALLQRERARLRAGLPSLPVGCCTMSPPFNAGAWVGDTLNAVTDVVVYTYDCGAQRVTGAGGAEPRGHDRPTAQLRPPALSANHLSLPPFHRRLALEALRLLSPPV